MRIRPLQALLSSPVLHILTNEMTLDTFPSLIVNGVTQGQWTNVRMTNNHYSNEPVSPSHLTIYLWRYLIVHYDR
jgi:hypothetical protein